MQESGKNQDTMLTSILLINSEMEGHKLIMSPGCEPRTPRREGSHDSSCDSHWIVETVFDKYTIEYKLQKNRAFYKTLLAQNEFFEKVRKNAFIDDRKLRPGKKRKIKVETGDGGKSRIKNR